MDLIVLIRIYVSWKWINIHLYVAIHIRGTILYRGNFHRNRKLQARCQWSKKTATFPVEFKYWSFSNFNGNFNKCKSVRNVSKFNNQEKKTIRRKVIGIYTVCYALLCFLKFAQWPDVIPDQNSNRKIIPIVVLFSNIRLVSYLSRLPKSHKNSTLWIPITPIICTGVSQTIDWKLVKFHWIS